MDPVDHDRVRGAAGADHGHGVLPHMHLLVETHRQPGWIAALTPLVGGKDDRGRVDHVAGRLMRAGAGRGAAMVATGERQRSEPGSQRRSRPADRCRGE